MNKTFIITGSILLGGILLGIGTGFIKHIFRIEDKFLTGFVFAIVFGSVFLLKWTLGLLLKK